MTRYHVGAEQVPESANKMRSSSHEFINRRPRDPERALIIRIVQGLADHFPKQVRETKQSIVEQRQVGVGLWRFDNFGVDIAGWKRAEKHAAGLLDEFMILAGLSYCILNPRRRLSNETKVEGVFVQGCCIGQQPVYTALGIDLSPRPSGGLKCLTTDSLTCVIVC